MPVEDPTNLQGDQDSRVESRQFVPFKNEKGPRGGQQGAPKCHEAESYLDLEVHV